MNKVFTYCRVSTTDQNLEAQKEELLKAHPEAELHCEKASATNIENRPVLQTVLKAIRSGDKLLVWKIDRLVRNMRDLSEIVALLKKKRCLARDR